MTHIITSLCVRDRGCIDVCPVECMIAGQPLNEWPWIYIDPEMSQFLASVHRFSRVERWLFNGLHSLDFSFLYNSRPLWDIVMLVLLVGGLVSSFLGLYLGIGRMRRGTKRALSGLSGGARQPEPAE